MTQKTDRPENSSLNLVRKTSDFLYAPSDPALHVAMNFDAGFYLPAGVAITSLCENNRDLSLAAHIFTDAACASDLEHLCATARRYSINIHLHFLDLAPLQSFHIQHHHYSHLGFARLYMPEVMVNYAPRYLYLDADTILDGSLQELLNFDLHGKTIGGVISNPDFNRQACTFHGIKHGCFINSGVMLVNAAQWVEKGYTEQAFSYRGRSAKQFIGHDQDIVNLVADGDITLIPEKFNDFSGALWKAGKESVVIHYLGRLKPWKLALDVTPLVALWRKYALLSQWPFNTAPLPSPKPENYYYFKYAARHYRRSGQWIKALNSYLTYMRLKLLVKYS